MKNIIVVIFFLFPLFCFSQSWKDSKPSSWKKSSETKNVKSSTNSYQCINDIKDCMFNEGGEICFSKAINKYCGTSFDVTKNQWWYDMQNWAKSSKSNFDKLSRLSELLKKEAKDKGSNDLKWIAFEAIDEDILLIN